MVGIFHGYVSHNQMVHGLHAPAMKTEDPHHAGNSPNSDRSGISWPRRETFENFHCLPAITDDYGKNHHVLMGRSWKISDFYMIPTDSKHPLVAATPNSDLGRFLRRNT